MSNKRIYYATQAVALRPEDADGNPFSTWYYPKGVQSAGISTNFTLEQVFQLGQLELYDNVEDVPEVEVTLNKVIDGTAPLYLMCMGGDQGIAGASGKELPELANNRVDFRLAVYADTQSAATGTASTFVDCSGMYVSSVSYTIPVDGNATEDVTLVGNSKIWNSGANPGSLANTQGAETAPYLARRYAFSKSQSTVPTGKGGIPSGKTGIQNITVSMDLGREAINELGTMSPYFRYVTFPVEVTCEFEVIAISGDLVQADDFTSLADDCGVVAKNLEDKTIFLKICGSGSSDSLTLDLGSKNKLTSVSYSGGDAGGDNATISYSYQTFNKLVVTGQGSFLDDAALVITPPPPSNPE